MNRVFVDTSAWYALLNRDDPDHLAVETVLCHWEGRLVTSDYVFDEVVTLLNVRAGHLAAVRCGEALRPGELAALLPVEARDHDSAWTLFLQGRDKHYSYTDCTSFALIRRFKLTAVVATDAHFRQAGFRVLPEAQTGAVT